MKLTYIGGPTALLETAELRLLTDPTFDPGGGQYENLHKLAGPARSSKDLGVIDAVLLSHDHHADNLDRSGRALLAHAGLVFTTRAGAERLGANATGLENWQTAELGKLRVTGTPARHGPADMDRGPVTGFVLQGPERAVYISGDTVWYEGAAEVAKRFDIGVAILFMGAARVREVGPMHLTMTAAEGVEAARAFSNAVIVPLHYEGWAHFSESRGDIERAFKQAGLSDRLRWLPAGVPTLI